MATPGNGGPPQSPNAQEGQPQQTQAQLSVLGQYVKDLSFENPNAPRSLAPTQTQPAINIQINGCVQHQVETDYEISPVLGPKAGMPATLLFVFNVPSAAVFLLKEV